MKRSKQAKRSRAIAARSADTRTPLEVYAAAVADATAAMVRRVFHEAPREGNVSPCREGCAECCYQPVMVTAADAIRIVDSLVSSGRMWSQELRDRLDAECAFEREFREAHPDATPIAPGAPLTFERRLERRPCVFLENERCSIYPVRPAVCALYYVFGDAENCDVRLNPSGFMHLARNADFHSAVYGSAQELAATVWPERRRTAVVGTLPELVVVVALAIAKPPVTSED